MKYANNYAQSIGLKLESRTWSIGRILSLSEWSASIVSEVFSNTWTYTSNIKESPISGFVQEISLTISITHLYRIMIELKLGESETNILWKTCVFFCLGFWIYENMFLCRSLSSLMVMLNVFKHWLAMEITISFAVWEEV